MKGPSGEPDQSSKKKGGSTQSRFNLGFKQGNKVLSSMASSFKKMIYGKKKDTTEMGTELGKKVQDTSTSASDNENSAGDSKSSMPKNTRPNEAIDLESNAAAGSNSFRNFQDQMKQIRLGQQYLENNPDIAQQVIVNEEREK